MRNLRWTGKKGNHSALVLPKMQADGSRFSTVAILLGDKSGC